MKSKLVIYGGPYQQESLFHSAWFESLIRSEFDLEPWQQHGHYSDSTVFVVGCNSWVQPQVREIFRERRVIIDALWESRTGKWGGLLDTLEPQHCIFYGNRRNTLDPRTRFVPAWFWYNESLWYQHKNWDQYRPNRTWKKHFLMPIGHWRGWRSEVVERLRPWLDDCYWSLVDHGQYLPGTRSGKRMDHRHHEACWFDDTHFSLVCESARSWDTAVEFLTEKTYKAIAGWHPFMVLGADGLLSVLRDQGFETFDNCFDESYDGAGTLAGKLDVVETNIQNYTLGGIDSETQRRVEHNRMLFYNNDRVMHGLERDVIEPIKEYVES
jgi:hypothetical protein